jgi:PPOX class probable F420-dependent enzyme
LRCSRSRSLRKTSNARRTEFALGCPPSLARHGRTALPTPAELDAIVERATVARLATINAAGHPSLVPVVFACLDGAIWSPVDGKAKRTSDLKRLDNVARHPRCALLIDRYDSDWQKLWWLRIDCDATVHSPAPNDPIVARVERALRAKYSQYETVPPLRSPVRLIELRPVARAAWAGEPLRWVWAFSLPL